MNSPEVIAEFVASLGINVSPEGIKSLKKMLKDVEDVAKSMAKFMIQSSVAILGAATAITVAIEKIADSFDKAFWASQRMGASVESFKAAGYAASQMGSSVGEVTQSMQGLFNFLRENQGGKANIMARLGIDVDAAGKQKDTWELLMESIEAIQTRYANNPAMQAMLAKQYGISDYLARSNVQQMRAAHAEYISLNAAMHVGLKDDGNGGSSPEAFSRFMNGYRKFSAQLEAVVNKVGVTILPVFQGYLEKFSNWIDTHSGDIAAYIEMNGPKVVQFFQDLGDAVGPFVTIFIAVGEKVGEVILGIIDWFNQLDPDSKKLVATLTLVAAALAVVGVAFGLALPIIASGITILKAMSVAADVAATAMGALDVSMLGLTWPILAVVGVLALLAAAIYKISNGDLTNQMNALKDGFAAIMRGDMTGATKRFGDLLTGNYPTKKEALNLDGEAKTFTPDTHGIYLKGTSGDPDKIFSEDEAKYGLQPGLLAAVRQTESGGNDNAVSRTGAQGPMQFMPKTAKDYGLANPFDLNSSADAASRYLRDMLKRYNGDLVMALAAYNEGPTRLDKDGLANAPDETKKYVLRVVGQMRSNPHASGQLASAGYSPAGGGSGESAPITITQTNHNTFTGVSNPQQAAAAVTKANQSNASKLRNIQVAVQ